MRLVSWNVAGRVRTIADQAARVLALAPDLVCLQEITDRAAPQWARELRVAGLAHVVHPLAPSLREPRRTRRLSVLIASRSGPINGAAVSGVPWPERALAAHVPGGLEVVNLHSPISPSPGLAKVLTHEAVHAHLRTRGAAPCILCGDLNTPRREHPDGTAWTFARDRYGRLRPDRGERWDAAELALVKGLEESGFRDAFRSRHGYAQREPTWEWPRTGGGYRLDHLIVSAPVRVADCRYEHAWRREGLSDHSALVAELSWGPE